MSDALADAWATAARFADRLEALEEIADRLAATCADPQAVTDYFDWKAAGEPT